jgi:hypothetical protein
MSSTCLRHLAAKAEIPYFRLDGHPHANGGMQFMRLEDVPRLTEEARKAENRITRGGRPRGQQPRPITQLGTQ